MTTSEVRYRRLLMLYPRDFRQEYEEEILGVLMTDGRNGPGQVLDLVRAALTVRLRQAVAATDWRRAAWVVQVFGAILLLALAVRRVGFLRVLTVPDASILRLDTLDGVRLAGWAIVLVAALRGYRLLGAAAATAALAAEIAVPFRSYADTPATVLAAYWLITAAAVVLVAGLVAVQEDVRLRGWILVAVAGVALKLQGVLPWDAMFDFYYRDATFYALAGGAAVLILLAVLRQAEEIRRWMLVWAAPVLATVPLVRLGFGDLIEYNTGHPESLRFIDGLQWATLAVVPVLAFGAAAFVATRFRDWRLGTK